MKYYNYKHEWTEKLSDTEFEPGRTFRKEFIIDNLSVFPFFLKMIHTNLFVSNKRFKNVGVISKVLEDIDDGMINGKYKKYGFFEKMAFKKYLGFRIWHRIFRKIEGLSIDIQDSVVILNSDGFIKGNTNFFWDSIIKELEEQKVNYHIINYDRFWQPNNFRALDGGTDDIAQFCDVNSRSDIYRLYKTIKSTWSNLRQNNNFKNLFVYNGISIYDKIIDHMDFVFNIMSLYVAEVIVTTKNITNKRPKSVLIDHEDNYYGLGCMYNRNRHKVVALSYELIYKDCMSAHYKNKDLMDKNSNIWRPLPDMKIVANTEEKDILEKYSAFPKGIIKVLGNPKYDILKKNYLEYDRPRNPVILYAMSERTDLLEEIRKGIPEGWELKIKTHPNCKEKIDGTVNGDLYSMIRYSDMVIIDTSSVGTEAILLNKPLFVINPEGKSPQGYEKEGVALVSKVNRKDIESKLVRFFYSLKAKEKMSKKRQTFIRKHFVNYGNSAEKIVNEVLKNV